MDAAAGPGVHAVSLAHSVVCVELTFHAAYEVNVCVGSVNCAGV